MTQIIFSEKNYINLLTNEKIYAILKTVRRDITKYLASETVQFIEMR